MSYVRRKLGDMRGEDTHMNVQKTLMEGDFVGTLRFTSHSVMIHASFRK